MTVTVILEWLTYQSGLNNGIMVRDVARTDRYSGFASNLQMEYSYFSNFQIKLRL